jgi:hypothetical protein
MDQSLVGQLVRTLGWTSGNNADEESTDPQLLEEMRRVNVNLERQLEDDRSARQTLPRPGASAAAAIPTTQRLGR